MRIWHVALPTALVAALFALAFSCSTKDDGSTDKTANCGKAALLDTGKPGGGPAASTSTDCTSPSGGGATTGGDSKDITTVGDKGSSTSTGTECALTKNTTATTKVNTYGCAVLTRDTSSCKDSRVAQGFSGFWLNFSCNVTLTKSGTNVILTSNDLPDYKTYYLSPSDACYEAFTSTDRKANPNLLQAQTITMTVPYAPTAAASPVAMSGGVIGMSVNGVAIYSNTAAPGDDIYQEVDTFDKCDGHPDQVSRYHYHTEPSAITNADAAFVGVMRDGFPVYGRNDYETNAEATGLDSAGGKTGKTVDSPDAAVYHYNVNLQTNGTSSAYFIAKGDYAGTPGDCTGCR